MDTLKEFANRWRTNFTAGQDELAPSLFIVNDSNEEIDWSGLDSMTVRLQLGSADELEITLPAKDNSGAWRPDMGIWQKGAVLIISMGYDGDFDNIQRFSIVSTTVNYPSDGAEMLTVRGVSDLARALHNRDARVFSEPNDMSVIDDICASYGWTNGVTAPLADSRARVKAKGQTDLDILRTISRDALIGAPRLDVFNVLMMPEPLIGDHTYVRGVATNGARRILEFSPSREGGADAIQVQITAWDPAEEKFVDIVFQANEFSSDPEIVFEGPAAVQEAPTDSSTRGLTLKVLEVRGYGPEQQKDVIATGQFVNETDAESLAKRWFDLREKLSRWANIEVPGHSSLAPYIAVRVDGELAAMDRGLWLPTTVEHNLSESGWTTKMTCVRVVEETTVAPA